MAFRFEDLGDALAAQSTGLVNERVARMVAGRVRVGVWDTECKSSVMTLREKLTRERDDLVAAMTELGGQLARRTAQLEELARYPEEDPYGDDTVLRFRKRFPGGDKEYVYAAAKTGGLWYVTGDRAPNGVEWTELVAWMGLGVSDVTKIAPGRAAKVAW